MYQNLEKCYLPLSESFLEFGDVPETIIALTLCSLKVISENY